jgi:hypothetical protein
MKQTLVLTLALVGWSSWATLAALEQGADAQPADLASLYAFGPAHVTISTRAGQVLSVLDVPAGVAVSIHLIKGESTEPSDKVAMTFTGDVSIRTTLRSEFVKATGPSRDRMMKAPLRLDVQDALVVLTQNR